ncbi:5-demethoxyubiquinol-8 5-hydroxylase UbiM [Dokdonella sp.]|uniref:5-demethoxyubiquinol-8 5-hydroxylase UbiM n=1 Tax=Dokdonella sp. TaxID=2291710 RepID=UPI0025C1D3FF|nr:5-demethoxyubiquinol-8 5-hydroxylase UbiM [Dokdonella sp.]MBX3689205.1 5-demethoxyubiquinol-8 5-hydroxylase UbiM [Dokdonella sp.]
MNENVVIIGAGPAGLCLSLALAARGIEVDIVERQEAEALTAPAYDGREIALTNATMRVLRELGVWERLPADGIAPIRQARVMDGANPGFEVDAGAFGHDRIGVLVANHHIRSAAWQAVCGQPRIRVHCGVAVESVSTDVTQARILFADRRLLNAALLIAADSRFSQTRRSMGIPVHMHDFGKTMVLARMRHAVANDGTAWEWFGQGHTRALLPLGEHLSSTVLTVPGHVAQALMALSDAEFAKAIAAHYEGRLGEMELASTRHAYPLVATWARRFVAPRFALAGDAAVGMHPVTAHGFNLGVASVELLARAAGEGLQRYRDPGHPQWLARYQRQHRAGSAVMFAGTQAVAGLFTDERAFAQPLRKLAIGAVRALPMLRRALVAGLLDESPRPPSLVHQLGRTFEILRPRIPRSQASA